MNILMLNYEYPPIGGGASRATFHLLKEFSHLDGIKVDLITSSISNRFEIEGVGDNIQIHKIPIKKGGRYYWTQREILTYSYKSVSYIRKLKKNQKYDLCHAFFGVPCGVMAYIFRKEMPYIVSLRGSDVPGFNPRFSFQYTFLKPIIKKVWSEAKSVVANSQGLRELALKTNPNQKIEVIYNGVDTQKFRPASQKNRDKIRILSVARLIERKGLNYLIEAIPSIIENQNNVEVLIVGEGNLHRELQRKCSGLGIQKYVKFLGGVNNDDLPSIYSNSDIFVLPSLNEGMSNTILEAMASGLPIITTDTGGSKELIDKNGIIIPIMDSKAISDAIMTLISNERLRYEMGRKSRRKAEEMSWERVAKDYFNLYSKILRA
ncbi:MAG: glycosyltransferase family 4 protein [Candidatus Njordarchaeota archaeon]